MIMLADKQDHQSMSKYRHMSPVYNQGKHTIWIGDLQAAQDTEELRARGIKTVISAIQGYELHYDKDIVHFLFNIQDSKSQNITVFLQEADRRISEGLRNGSVLVHCAAGVSRSTTLVIAFLIKSCKMSFHQALKLCKSGRPEVCPNLNFERQLKAFQFSLKLKEQSRAKMIKKMLQTHIKENATVVGFPQISKRVSSVANNKKRHQATMDLSGIGCGGGGISRLISRRGFGDPKELYGRRLTPVQRRENYLRQIAQFRFGITSLGKFNDSQF